MERHRRVPPRDPFLPLSRAAALNGGREIVHARRARCAELSWRGGRGLRPGQVAGCFVALSAQPERMPADLQLLAIGALALLDEGAAHVEIASAGEGGRGWRLRITPDGAVTLLPGAVVGEHRTVVRARLTRGLLWWVREWFRGKRALSPGCPDAP